MAYTDKMFQLGMKYTSLIKTSYVHPPIPIRDFDWCAYIDGYEENTDYHAYGKTEKEAIKNLLDNCSELFNV
jgi:hypothetical protein